MARKKKKKGSEIAISQQESASVSKPAQSCLASPQLPASTINASQKNPCRVALSTCIAGMFLCLVLGLYLGSLLPGVMEDLKKPDQTVSMSPPVPAAQGGEQGQVSTQTPGKPAPQAMNTPGRDINAHMGHLEKEVAQNPGNNAAWIELGNLYFDTNQPKLAIQAYERSLAIDPKNVDVLTDLGIMYRETENFAKAVECFRKASALDPSHQNSLFNEGIVLSMDLHNNPEAIKAWTKLLQVNPNARAPNGESVAEMIKKLQ